MPDITIVCYDTRDHSGSLRTLLHCQKSLPFRTSILPISYPLINDPWDYDRLILSELYKLVNTSHVLIVQTDGFILNPGAWTDSFYEYDYIGAPWQLHPQHFWPPFPNVTNSNRVGNGGFSLRSRRLLQQVSGLFNNLKMTDGSKLTEHKEYWHPEDCFIARSARSTLESIGIKFAPLEVANKFSVENNKVTDQFGFHGKLTMQMNNINYL